MRLSTRLVLLVLGCLLPVLTAQVYSQINLHAERHEQLGSLAMRQAELANADMASIMDGVRQLGAVTGQLTAGRGPGTRCSERLTSLQRSLVQYRFLALFAPADGALLCASDGLPAGFAGGGHQWLVDLLNTPDVSLGQLVSEAADKGPYIPVAVRVPGLPASEGSAVLVAALNTDWLALHLATARVGQAPAPRGAALTIADSSGVIVGHVPEAAEKIGSRVPDWFRPLISRQNPGVETVADTNGHSYIVAFVPSTGQGGFAVIDAFSLPELTDDIDQATYQDLLVISGAAIAALILAWVAGRRFIYQPTEALLRAARKWREGDLGARASVTDAGSEFSALAQSFNAMAAGVQAREMERRMQSSFLEAQVAERTRELSETNNRLQVEIAGREKTEAALHQAQKLQAVGSSPEELRMILTTCWRQY